MATKTKKAAPKSAAQESNSGLMPVEVIGPVRPDHAVYYRAGRAWAPGRQVARVTKEQYEQLEQDPLIIVEEISERDFKDGSTTSGGAVTPVVALDDEERDMLEQFRAHRDEQRQRAREQADEAAKKATGNKDATAQTGGGVQNKETGQPAQPAPIPVTIVNPPKK